MFDTAVMANHSPFDRSHAELGTVPHFLAAAMLDRLPDIFSLFAVGLSNVSPAWRGRVIAAFAGNDRATPYAVIRHYPSQ